MTKLPCLLIAGVLGGCATPPGWYDFYREKSAREPTRQCDIVRGREPSEDFGTLIGEARFTSTVPVTRAEVAAFGRAKGADVAVWTTRIDRIIEPPPQGSSVSVFVPPPTMDPTVSGLQTGLMIGSMNRPPPTPTIYTAHYIWLYRRSEERPSEVSPGEPIDPGDVEHF